MDPILDLDWEGRICAENSCICKSLPTHCHPQVRSVSWSEARFGCCQGIHVQSQPETEPAEEHRNRRHGCGSPEHHQGRHWLLPVYGQLQWEVETQSIHKGFDLLISNSVTDRNCNNSHCSLCAIQIKALAKIHAYVVDPWVTCTVHSCCSIATCDGVNVCNWLCDTVLISVGPFQSRSKQTLGRSAWNFGGCVEKLWYMYQTEIGLKRN